MGYNTKCRNSTRCQKLGCDVETCISFNPAPSCSSQFSGSVPRSDGLLEMWMERDPAKWAAHQIAAKGYPCQTVGEAMDMIEAIVREAMKMEQNIEA